MGRWLGDVIIEHHDIAGQQQAVLKRFEPRARRRRRVRFRWR
jgi:hypothetical protein